MFLVTCLLIYLTTVKLLCCLFFKTKLSLAQIAMTKDQKTELSFAQIAMTKDQKTKLSLAQIAMTKDQKNKLSNLVFWSLVIAI
jgi:hypothetical protein